MGKVQVMIVADETKSEVKVAKAKTASAGVPDIKSALGHAARSRANYYSGGGVPWFTETMYRMEET